MHELNIDNYIINEKNDPFVIAEIGHNHQGKLDQAKELFRSAANCGANAVKLQKRSNRTLYTKEMFDQPYNSENAFAETYGEHREFLEFGRDEYVELQNYAKELGIIFFSTAFDFESADFLADINMPAYKIASADLTNIPLIQHVAHIGKPMIMSTGGGSMDDVKRAHDAATRINSQLCIMQCTASYPCDFDKLNLRVIETYRKEFPGIAVGLSSHDNGYTMSLIAYMLGAQVFEKHFTLTRSMKGTDHAFSLESSGLRRLVRDLKRSRIALGDGIKQEYEAESLPLIKMRKKLVASRRIPKGHTLTRTDIALKSPGDGTPPYELETFIGRVTAVPLNEDDDISIDIVID